MVMNASTLSASTGTVILSQQEADTCEATDEDVTLRDGNGVEYAGKVTCGTFSSLAVIVDHGGLTRDDVIEADYGGLTIPATVRRAYRRPDGKWIVTLRWGR
jgi:hypothetical protein